MVAIPAHITAPAIDLEPRSTYEVLTREKVEQLAADLGEVRGRTNAIFYLVITSVLLDVLLQWV
jgi:hypothetical protein